MLAVGAHCMKRFTDWPEPMQRLMAWVVVGLFAVVLARCALDLVKEGL